MAWGCVEILLAGQEGKGVLGARGLGRELKDDLAHVRSDGGRLGAWSCGGVWQADELALCAAFLGVSALHGAGWSRVGRSSWGGAGTG